MNQNPYSFNNLFSETINKVKGWSILLVVLGHIASPLSALIYSFHIPLFFFLGGLFIKTTSSVSSYIWKNFNRLMVPYFIFGFIGWVVNSLKNIALHRPPDDVLQSAIGLFWWMDVAHLNHYGFVLWFLPALFWARLIIYFIEKHLGFNGLLLLSVLALIANSASNAFVLPFGIDKAITVLPWVIFGLVFNRYKNELLTVNVWKIIFLVLAALIPVYFMGLQRLDIATKDVGNIFVSIPYTFSVIFLIIYSAYHLKLGSIKSNFIGKMVSQFGVFSMLILVAHPYTNNITYLLVNYFLKDGFWAVKFALSVIMLLILLRLKFSFNESCLFKWL